MTDWAQQVNPTNVLPEYPRPQMTRSNWMILNGIWQFQPGATNDPVPTGQNLASTILVPFPDGVGVLSGVMQYSRVFVVSAEVHACQPTGRANGSFCISRRSTGVRKSMSTAKASAPTPAVTIPLVTTSRLISMAGRRNWIVRVYNPEDKAAASHGGKTDARYSGGHHVHFVLRHLAAGVA